MTPPENAESTSASPPWQRVAKEIDEQASAEGRTDYLPRQHDEDWNGQGPAFRRETDELMAHTGDLPIVTGTAAQGLFGNPPADRTERSADEDDAAKGQGRVSVANAGTRGRSAPSALRRPGRGPRRASLMVKRIDPWSVLKLSLVLGVAMFLVWMVAVGLLYIVLDGMGVWDKLNGTYTSLVSGEGADSLSEPLISAGRVFGIAAIVGMINIVLLSALATVSAFIYNVSADLAGGLEVTLSERE